MIEEQPEDSEKSFQAPPTRLSDHGQMQAWTSNSLQSLLNTKSAGIEATVDSSRSTNNLLTFLAIVQHYEIDLVPYTYELEVLLAGSGATSNIRQKHLSRQAGLVFKVIRIRDARGIDDNEATYNTLISEISVLAHDSLRHHPGIVRLECVSFEVAEDSAQVWPILVLPKAQYGNLDQFMRTEHGRQTTLKDRMEFCIQIASAVLALHTHGFVHGDIKPQNIVVFRHEEGHPYMALTDFGYTSKAKLGDLDVVIKIPKSTPWNAPEHHHRGFTVRQARATDLYSLGLLFLWLLFYEAPLTDSAIELLGAGKSEIKKVSQLFQDTTLMEKLKAEGIISSIACHLAQDPSSVCPETAGLTDLFHTILDRNPQMRSSSLSHLHSSLDTEWLVQMSSGNLSKHVRTLSSTVDCFDMDLQTGKALAEFKVSNLIERDYNTDPNKIGPVLRFLFRCHLQVRQNVVSMLEDLVTTHIGDSTERNAAFQLAICYSIGIGRSADESSVQRWLGLAHKTSEQLVAETDEIVAFLDDAFYQNYNLNYLIVQGVVINRELDYTNEPSDYIPALRKEIRDLQAFLGPISRPVFLLKHNLILVLCLHREFGQAEMLILTMLQDIRNRKSGTIIPPSEKITELMTVAELNPDDFVQPPRLQLPDVGPLQPRLDTLANIVSKGTLTSRTLMPTLAIVYACQQRWAEAIWLMIWSYNIRAEQRKCMNFHDMELLGVLARMYIEIDHLEGAEQIFTSTSLALEELMGTDHPSTLEHRQLLAMVKFKQKKYDEAEPLIVKALEEQERIFSPNSRAIQETVTVLLSLANAYREQHRLEEADRLLERCHEVREFLAREFTDCIITISTALVYDYIQSNDSHRVEQLCNKVLPLCDHTSPVRVTARLYIHIALAMAILAQQRIIEATKAIGLAVQLSQEASAEDQFKSKSLMAVLVQEWFKAVSNSAARQPVQALVASSDTPETETDGT